MKRIRRRGAILAAGLALATLLPPVAADGPYGLPLCQRIFEDTERDPEVKQAQLTHCDKAEEAYREFIYQAQANGEDLDEAYFFAMLFMTTAHWQKLAEIEVAITACGDGSCAEGEDAQSCPQDCDASAGEQAGGGTGPSGPGGGL